MSSRGAKSDGKSSKASGKSDRPKAKDGEVISEVDGGKGSDDVVVVEDHKERTADGYTCKTCRGADSDDMVQCDQCDGWHHYNCVGVTDGCCQPELELCQLQDCDMEPANNVNIR